MSAPGRAATAWAVPIGGGAAWLAILVIAATSHTPLRYDEPFYLAPAAAFDRYGLSFALLRNYPEVTGIIHTAIQWLAAPLTHLDVPGVRIVNTLVMGAAIGASAALLTIAAPRSASFALALLALPPVWVIAGMALTEPPAIAFLALGLAMFYATPRVPRHGAGLALAAAGGLTFAVAVLAKQGALAVLGGIAWLAWRRSEWRPAAAVFILVALTVLLPIFAAWGGVAPPLARQLQTGIFSLKHAIGALGYAGAFLFILAPALFQSQLRRAAPFIVAALAANAIFHVIEMRPLASVANRLLNAPALAIYDQLAGGAVIAAATLLVTAVLSRFRDHAADPIWTSAAVALLLGAASFGAVTHSFSGRYLTIISPLMLLVALPYRRADTLSNLLIVAGQAAGAISLLVYLQYLSR